MLLLQTIWTEPIAFGNGLQWWRKAESVMFSVTTITNKQLGGKMFVVTCNTSTERAIVVLVVTMGTINQSSESISLFTLFIRNGVHCSQELRTILPLKRAILILQRRLLKSIRICFRLEISNNLIVKLLLAFRVGSVQFLVFLDVVFDAFLYNN